MSTNAIGKTRVPLIAAIALLLVFSVVATAAGQGNDQTDEGGRYYPAAAYEKAKLNVTGEVTKELLRSGVPMFLEAPKPDPLSTPDIDEDLAIRLAFARARWQWGENVRLGTVTPVYGLEGELYAYDVDFTLDGSVFGDYRSVAENWRECRARMRLSGQSEAGGKPDDLLQSRETGSREYGSVTVTATYDAPPFRGTRAGVSNFYSAGWVAAEVASQALGPGAVELKRVIINGSWARLYEFTNGMSTVVVQGHQPWGWYEANELSEVSARVRDQKRQYIERQALAIGQDIEELKEVAREENTESAQKWLDGAIMPASPQYIPGYNTSFTPYSWHLGCSPTAASMVLNYYDEISSYGRLTKFYGSDYDPPQDQIDCHVSDMAPRMAELMDTNDEGTTMPWKIRPAMEDYANTDCGYSFSGGIDCLGTIVGWCCGSGQDMIDDNLPFVWNLSFYGGSSDHSVAVVGYDTSPDPDEFACYNTWSNGNIIEWQSCAGTQYDTSLLTGHVPGGGSPFNVKLTSHDGYQSYDQCGQTGTVRGGTPTAITWDNNGHPAHHVDVYYSLDAGDTWTYIITSSDDEFHEWTPPCGTSSSRARIRIVQYAAGDVLLSSDGSYGNFTVLPHLPPATPSLTYPASGATCVERDVRLEWTPGSTSGGYEVQIGTSCSSGPTYSTPDEYLDLSLSPSTEYYWRVRAKLCGDWGSWSSCFNFETGPAIPGQPALLLPVDGAACKDTSVVLNWQDVAVSAYYKVQLGTSCGTGAIRTVTSSNETWGSLNWNTTYHWRVRALNSCDEGAGWTACRSFTTREAPPRTPGLLSPPDESGCADTCMVLSWENLPRADYYKVQVGNTCGLGPVRDIVGSDTTLCGLDWNATYYWRVRAIGDCEYSSSWSECRSFITLLDGVGVPDLIQPPHMATCMDTSVLLDWEDIPGAVTYEIQIDTTCGSPMTHYGYTESEMTVNGLDRNKTYHWRVRAIDGCDEAGKWSTCSTFTTRGSGIPDNNAGKWALHYAGPHSTSNNCLNHGLTGCGDLVVDAPSGPGRYDIYVVAIDVGIVKETRFGLKSDICPMVFYSWTPCDTPYETPSSGWPDCGESNHMSWSTPQCGPFKVLGVLDVYTYGGSILGTDIDQRVGYAEWCDDGVPPRRITITNEDKFGWIGFGEPGYNPCGLVSVIPRGSDHRPSMLGQNAPNPARRSSGTTIHYSLATAEKATISIFDVVGRKVREIELLSKAGDNQVSWDCRDQNGRLVPSGVYFYQLRSPGFSSERKMLVAE